MNDKSWEIDADYLTLDQAAQILKIKADRVERLIEGSKLKGFRLGCDWLTTIDWIDEYKQGLRIEMENLISDQGESSPFILPIMPFYKTPAFKLSVVIGCLIIFFVIVLGTVYLSLTDFNLPKINDEKLTDGLNQIYHDFIQSKGQVAGISESNCPLDTKSCQRLNY